MKIGMLIVIIISFVFQNYNLMSYFVLDNVEMGMTLVAYQLRKEEKTTQLLKRSV